MINKQIDGKCLRALVEQLNSLHPQLMQLCQSAHPLEGARLGDTAERQISAFARVMLMFTESYTQLLFEPECDFLLPFLGCCFRLSPKTAQPLFEFWAQVKEMQREGLLDAQQTRLLLIKLTESCVVSLLRFIHRGSSFSRESQEDMEVLRETAKDVVCDIYCLWKSCDGIGADEFVGFLSSQLMSSMRSQDAWGSESALVLLDGIADILESPLPATFVAALQALPAGIPKEVHAAGEAAVLLKHCAPHINAHVDVLRSALDFLMQVLPAIPHTASDCILELLGYAGHHLAPSMPLFLEAIEGLAPQFAERVDSDLYRSVVCTIRRLPVSEAPAAFTSILKRTMEHIVQIAESVGGNPVDNARRLPDQTKALLFRLLVRIRSCILTLEQTPETPDGPPPTGPAGKEGAAMCIVAVLGLSWDSFAKAVIIAVASVPPEAALTASSLRRTADSSSAEYSYNEVSLVLVCLRLLRSCISCAEALDHSRGTELVHRMRKLLVEIAQRNPTHCHVLSPLAVLVALAQKRGLSSEFAEAFDAVCAPTMQWLQGCGDVPLLELAPFFELLLAYSSYRNKRS